MGDRSLVLMTAMAENPALHKYDAAKGITTICYFFVKAEYSLLNEIQKFVGFFKLNFLFRELSQEGQCIFFILLSKGQIHS